MPKLQHPRQPSRTCLTDKDEWEKNKSSFCFLTTYETYKHKTADIFSITKR